MSVWLKFAQAVLAVLGFILALGNKKEDKVTDDPLATAKNEAMLNGFLEIVVRFFLAAIGFFYLGGLLWRVNDGVFLGGATIVLAILLMFAAKAAGHFVVRLIIGTVLGGILWYIDQYFFVGFSTVVLSIILLLDMFRGKHHIIALSAGFLLGIFLWFVDERAFLDGSIFVLSAGALLVFPLPRFRLKMPKMPKWPEKKPKTAPAVDLVKKTTTTTTTTEVEKPIEAAYRVIPEAEGGVA